MSLTVCRERVFWPGNDWHYIRFPVEFLRVHGSPARPSQRSGLFEFVSGKSRIHIGSKTFNGRFHKQNKILGHGEQRTLVCVHFARKILLDTYVTNFQKQQIIANDIFTKLSYDNNIMYCACTYRLHKTAKNIDSLHPTVTILISNHFCNRSFFSILISLGKNIFFCQNL